MHEVYKENKLGWTIHQHMGWAAPSTKYDIFDWAFAWKDSTFGWVYFIKPSDDHVKPQSPRPLEISILPTLIFIENIMSEFERVTFELLHVAL